MSLAPVEFTFWHEGALIARFDLEAGDFVVGRAESCEIIIDIEGMAPEQLRLRIGDRIVVENLAEGEGTQLGANRLTKPRDWDPNESIYFPGCGGTLRIDGGGEDIHDWIAQMAEKAAAEDRAAALEADLTAVRSELAAEREERRRGTEQEAKRSWQVTSLREEAASAHQVKEAAERASATAQQAFERERRRLEARLAEAAEEGRIGGEAMRVARLAWDAEREQLEARLAQTSEQSRAVAGQARIAADAEREAALAAVRREFSATRTEEQVDSATARNQAVAESRRMQDRVAELETALRELATEAARERGARAELEAERKSFEGQLTTARERHREETRALYEKLEHPEAGSVAVAVGDATRSPGSRDLLSIANKVLFNKIKHHSNLEQENDTLRKELKQREIALVAAWSDRQRAEERAAQSGKEAALAKSGKTEPAEPRQRRISVLALGLAVAMLLTIAGLSLWGMYLKSRTRSVEAIVAVVKPSAPQFYQQAKELIADGEFQEALDRLACATALEPLVADYHCAKGDAQESLLQLDAARDSYERGLDLNPADAAATANLQVCRRILATRHGAASAESMYALHGIMMEQKRLPEALRMAHRLSSDRPLLHRTLSAILVEARLPARLELNGDGSFDLDLSGPGRLDLSVLSHIPLRSLKLARSAVVDLSPLKGLPLKKLDLSETRVHDLSPLEGMPLTSLDLSKTDVSNLFPLEKMPLRELLLDDAPVSDISILQGMPLQSLHLAGTRVRNLAALAGSPLRTLDLSGTRVADLSALKHLPIERLLLNNTGAIDLTPLTGAPLTNLSLSGTEIDDLRPLQKLPLKELALGRCEKLRDIRALAACTSLERLTLPRQVTELDPLRKLPSLRFLTYEKAGALVDTEQSATEFWAQHKEVTGTAGTAKNGGK